MGSLTCSQGLFLPAAHFSAERDRRRASRFPARGRFLAGRLLEPRWTRIGCDDVVSLATNLPYENRPDSMDHEYRMPQMGDTRRLEARVWRRRSNESPTD